MVGVTDVASLDKTAVANDKWKKKNLWYQTAVLNIIKCFILLLLLNLELLSDFQQHTLNS